MSTVLLVIHLLLAVGLVGVILIQRSEGGGLGIGGGGGGGGFMTARGTANLLTRTTGILAGLFMLTSLAQVVLANYERPKAQRSLLDVPAATAPAQPANDGTPKVPLAQ